MEHVVVSNELRPRERFARLLCHKRTRRRRSQCVDPALSIEPENRFLALPLPLASAFRRFPSQVWRRGFGGGRFIRVLGLAMGAIETAVIVVVALVLGWGAVEIACKPCMESGRSAINRSLDPDYDPDDEIANTPYVEAPRRVEKEGPESPKKSYKVVKGEPSDV